MPTPQLKNPRPGGNEIYNFSKAFLCHHYYALCFSKMPRNREEFLKKCINFTLFTLKLPHLGVRGS